jgi:plasmid segregation protein ParM
MQYVVRAVDVGFGNTKYVSNVIGNEIRCANFPSIAYPSIREPSTQPGFERRKTVAIPINGLFYEVGPEVELAVGTFRSTQLHDRYTEAPEYLALLRGALAMMKLPVIDLLVVGLPVSSFSTKKAALEKAMTGEHNVGGGKSVTVKMALAVAQPQGALVDFAVQHQKMNTIKDEMSLIIDPGSRTFDWLVARGMRLVQNKSSSVNRGVSDMLLAIAEEISADIGNPFSDIDAIDRALRKGQKLTIFQKPYDLSQMMPIVHSIAQQAVASMLRLVGDSYGFQNIILVGGGAPLFKKAVKGAFPKHRILEINDPLHANVRGFQIAGMNQAPKLFGSTPAAQGEVA